MRDTNGTSEPSNGTARGDREQRRRDVLAASASVLDELGWERFSMREVARRAGVSPGAVYQWFTGKGELWARLQGERFAQLTDEVRTWPDDLDAVEVVARSLAVIAGNHAEVGRHRFDFVRELDGTIPEYAFELSRAYAALEAEIAARLDPLMPAELSDDERRARLAWVWAAGKGIGDHLVDERWTIHGIDRDAFLAAAARAVAVGLANG